MINIDEKKALKIHNISDYSKHHILVDGTYINFLNKENIRCEEIMTCPTDALELDKHMVNQEKCVDCLLCAYSCKEFINFQEESNSFTKFANYVIKDKRFLAIWLGSTFTSNSQNDLCGFEVKITGGYRCKRIPLLMIINKKPIIVKIVNSFKDIEHGVNALTDIVELIKKNNYRIPKLVIVPMAIHDNIDESTNEHIELLKQKNNFKILTIKEAWKILKDKVDGKEPNLEKIFFM